MARLALRMVGLLCCWLMILPLCVPQHIWALHNQGKRISENAFAKIGITCLSAFRLAFTYMQYSQTRLCLVAETDLNTTGIGVATILSALATAKNHRFPSYPSLIHQTPNFALSLEPNITRTIFSRLSRHHDSVGCRESLQDAKAVDEAVPGRPTRESNRFCRRRCPEEYSTD